MATSSDRQFLPLALVVLLVGACFDLHTAEECDKTSTCPPPADAGVIVVVEQAPPGACEGTCVPGTYAGWSPPFLARLSEDTGPSKCPLQATNPYWFGFAPPPAPTCGGCTCQASTGSCALPAGMTANTAMCGAPSSGTAFDPPSPWDGSCTTQDAVAGGVQSVTVAPLVVTEDGCVAVPPVVPQNLPKSAAFVQSCTGAASGVCPNSGDLCQPALPSKKQDPGATWTYCVQRQGAGDEYTSKCPTQYPEMFVFAAGYTDTRACSPCTCGLPEGSGCSSLVAVYADGACSDEIGSVTALSSGPQCVDMPPASPLGSKAASPPEYEPGTCPAGGGSMTGSLLPDEAWTLCCLP
jgi:hypothetical protein